MYEWEEDQLKPMQIANRVFLALLCGASMPFTFSPYDLNWMAIIAIAIWAWLLIKGNHTFLISYAFGFGWFGIGSWWLADT
ncbi:MAG: hypothetical protein R8K54_00530, partial [Mariprofundaceae bacterium]